jgi:hypothetical protein
MARRVFFSFHYDNDVWRANQVRNANVVASVPYGMEFPAYDWDRDLDRFRRAIEAAGKRSDAARALR